MTKPYEPEHVGSRHHRNAVEAALPDRALEGRFRFWFPRREFPFGPTDAGAFESRRSVGRLRG